MQLLLIQLFLIHLFLIHLFLIQLLLIQLFLSVNSQIGVFRASQVGGNVDNLLK